jgi:hypothetical protein
MRPGKGDPQVDDLYISCPYLPLISHSVHINIHFTSNKCFGPANMGSRQVKGNTTEDREHFSKVHRTFTMIPEQFFSISEIFRHHFCYVNGIYLSHTERWTPIQYQYLANIFLTISITQCLDIHLLQILFLI